MKENLLCASNKSMKEDIQEYECSKKWERKKEKRTAWSKMKDKAGQVKQYEPKGKKISVLNREKIKIKARN